MDPRPLADTAPDVPATQAATMDGNYRWQRHVYDLTRRYYLFGRDRLLQRLDAQPGERILEAGCGTARNLLKLARRQPGAHLYGLDASSLMLETAAARVAAAGAADKITLRCILAEQLDYRATFGLDAPFDAVFYSYALSMIPPWRAAVEAGWANLRPGGRLLAVDFWDAGGLPHWAGRLLHGWLAMFHTHPQPEIISFIESLPGGGPARVEAVGPRYALLISRRKL